MTYSIKPKILVDNTVVTISTFFYYAIDQLYNLPHLNDQQNHLVRLHLADLLPRPSLPIKSEDATHSLGQFQFADHYITVQITKLANQLLQFTTISSEISDTTAEKFLPQCTLHCLPIELIAHKNLSNGKVVIKQLTTPCNYLGT